MLWEGAKNALEMVLTTHEGPVSLGYPYRILFRHKVSNVRIVEVRRIYTKKENYGKAGNLPKVRRRGPLNVRRTDEFATRPYELYLFRRMSTPISPFRYFARLFLTCSVVAA